MYPPTVQESPPTKKATFDSPVLTPLSVHCLEEVSYTRPFACIGP
jgi:hypothetical protein